MGSLFQALGLERLSHDERLQLIDEIWESLPVPTSIPASHLPMLHERLDFLDANPNPSA